MTLHVMQTTGTGKGPLALVALAVLLLGAVSAQAQTFPPGTIEYTAKFLCGAVPSTGSTMVLPNSGTFKTSINIHNPALPGSNVLVVTFQKKAVQSIQEPPAGTALPPPGTLVTDSLQPDFAEEIDCPVIKTKLLPQPPPAGFVEGWVVIYSLPTTTGGTVTPNPLDVEGVYTNSNGALEILPAKEHDF